MDIALELSGLADIPPDSGIWVPGTDIHKILFGIDAGPAELSIAQQLGYDLLLAHHPPEATLEAWKDYLRHVEQMVAAGVPEDTAREAVAERIEAMQLGAHARNDEHTVSVARLLNMPYMNIHTPLDEIGRARLQRRFDDLTATSPQVTVGDVFEALRQFPEVREARVPPLLAVGQADATAGPVVVSHGALSTPNYDILKAYYTHGVGTVLVLRVSQADLVRLRQEQMGALIVIGHMAGDSLGFTPFLAALADARLEITTYSGVITT
jgi:hypothetical protein